MRSGSVTIVCECTIVYQCGAGTTGNECWHKCFHLLNRTKDTAPAFWDAPKVLLGANENLRNLRMIFIVAEQQACYRGALMCRQSECRF
ncbi:hypothetical protein QQF64_008864 [Cirrhinus molitorella]|uniref:SWIM-type domain-containing protein n=1 Tax=Cirrhinus molitorella TaxID=172907 RepID=A0ABR3M7F7_9TELE